MFQKTLKNQFLDADELAEVSWKKTTDTIHSAYENVPWYRKKFDEKGLHPDNIVSEEDFQLIPVLSRTELIQNFSEFISQRTNSEKLKISTTGGSTGTPLKIGMDPKANRETAKWQMFSWWNLSPAVNMATLYRGLPVRGVKKLALSLINWPQKVIRLDATSISKAEIDRFIFDFKKYKPKLVHGYVGALDVLADHILKHNIKLPSPKVVWTTAAPLSKLQENKISKAFGAPVCDQYGCSEMYFISAECPAKEGLHIFSDLVKVEILDEHNKPVSPGTYGKIVLTNLNDDQFPLIRYENGDRGRLLNKTCTCGMALPLMDKVKGRISDNISLPNGTILSGEYLTTIFDNYTDAVKQFQIIQRKSGDISVNIVFIMESAENQKISNKVKAELDNRVKGQVKLKVESVSSISSLKGKLQFIIKE